VRQGFCQALEFWPDAAGFVREDPFAARFFFQGVDLVGELEHRSVHFQSLTDGINTKTPAGRFFFHVMASLAQMERELLVERTRAGLVAAKKMGRVGGRKRRMTESKIQSGKTLLISGVSPKEVARNLGVSIPTLYRWLPASERS
jgi:DNA invertase Pin-like site-specific DNA recombinase